MIDLLASSARYANFSWHSESNNRWFLLLSLKKICAMNYLSIDKHDPSNAENRSVQQYILYPSNPCRFPGRIFVSLQVQTGTHFPGSQRRNRSGAKHLVGHQILCWNQSHGDSWTTRTQTVAEIIIYRNKSSSFRGWGLRTRKEGIQYIETLTLWARILDVSGSKIYGDSTVQNDSKVKTWLETTVLR